METKPQTTTQPAIVPVDFKARRRPTLKSLGKGVYAYPRACPSCGALVHPSDAKCQACQVKALPVVYYERPFVDGRQTTRKLKSRTLRHAQLECGKNRSDQALAKIGRAVDPYARTAVATVADLAELYLAAGCPKRDQAERAGKQLDEEKRRVENLKRHLGKKIWTKLTLEDLRDYHTARIAEIKHGLGGHRAVEIEENCLSSILRHAQRNHRRTGVTHNPIAHDRPRHRKTETIRHCRDLMPASGDEIHAIARYLFDTRQSEALGWLVLFQAFIGQRVGELVRLRMDAQTEREPGFIKGQHLWLHRSLTHKGTYPYAEIHAALRQCLAAHRLWHQLRFPGGSPWYFPSHISGGAQPVETGSLTHALRRICPAMSIPHRTSHGLRSFFVNVLRSQGKSDAEIALRIGHKSGGKLIVEVYGEVLPYKLTWLPSEGEPAWTQWTRQSGTSWEQLDLI